ncbi:MAG: hypothetical protein AAFY99_00325 [Pseudomonadota bacterium]
MALLDGTVAPANDNPPTQFETLTVVAAVLVVLTGAWGFFDERTIEGALVWMKPFKFAVSFVALFATIALVERQLSEPVRTGWLLYLTGIVMAAAFLAEMAYIIFQAAQAEASHFNFATPFNEFMYTVVMAAGAVALVAAVGFIGFLAKRDKQANLSPALRESIWLGFLSSFVLTLIVAGYMSGSGSHFVGVHPQGAPTLPLIGWSGVTGDLRPAHFLSLHAMQALPLLALWLDQRNADHAERTVRIAAGGYALVTLAIFAIALAGLPLVPMG